VSAATPFSPWPATSCVSLADPRDDRYRGDAPTLASWDLRAHGVEPQLCT
jgi:hypothetical protein